MVDAVAVGSALGAAKAAFDVTKAFVDVRDAAKVQAVKFELMGLLLQAQETEAALVAQKRELEERIRQLETWDREKQRYALTEVAPRVYAYVLKPEAKGPEPDHWLCAKCYQHGKKSILQSNGLPGVYGGTETFKCFECGAAIGIHHEGRDLPQAEHNPYY